MNEDKRMKTLFHAGRSVHLLPPSGQYQNSAFSVRTRLVDCVSIRTCVCFCVGLSVAVHHDFVYTGLSGFNGALGCMEICGLNFTFNWKTHLYAVANGDT